jgi:hypothetical protein
MITELEKLPLLSVKAVEAGEQPCLSIVLPFETKISLRKEMKQKIRIAATKVKNLLEEKYDKKTVQPILEKLNEIIEKGIDYDTTKKSIAIYISPKKEQILYLDIPVEEKIVIDKSFEIRDLISNYSEQLYYLAMLITMREVRFYIGTNESLSRITSPLPATLDDYDFDVSDKTGELGSADKVREKMTRKLLLQMDKALDALLKQYPYPVFVLGDEKHIGYFKELTHHATHLAGVVMGNYQDATEVELSKVLQPYIQQWKEHQQQELLKKLEEAYNAGRLSEGIHDVLKAVNLKQGQLLVVEKNYKAPQHIKNEVLQENIILKDIVDDIIEKVIAFGGEVKVVDDNVLKNYEHIALIRYYA